MLEAFTQLLAALGEASTVVIALSMGILFGYGFVKKWWVPGWIYQREVERGDRAIDAVDASTRTTEQAAVATKSATDTALAVANQLIELQGAISDARIRRKPPG